MDWGGRRLGPTKGPKSDRQRDFAWGRWEDGIICCKPVSCILYLVPTFDPHRNSQVEGDAINGARWSRGGGIRLRTDGPASPGKLRFGAANRSVYLPYMVHTVVKRTVLVHDTYLIWGVMMGNDGQRRLLINVFVCSSIVQQGLSVLPHAISVTRFTRLSSLEGGCVYRETGCQATMVYLPYTIQILVQRCPRSRMKYGKIP